jgi:hypothetical protein
LDNAFVRFTLSSVFTSSADHFWVLFGALEVASEIGECFVPSALVVQFWRRLRMARKAAPPNEDHGEWANLR